MILVLIAGILAHGELVPKPMLWLAAIALLFGIAIWQLRRAAICCTCLAAAVFLVGTASSQLDALFFPENHISLFTSGADHLADLELRIVDTPRISVAADARKLPPKQIVSAQAVAVRTVLGWQAASGKIIVSLEPPLDRLAAGQTIQALGWLSRPVPPDNPGQFDYAAYDRRQQILADFRIRRSEDVQVIRDDGTPPLVWLRQSARRLLAAGFSTEQKPDADFLQMLLLGDSDPQLKDVREDFALTGTAYQLSISGLHIAILGGATLLLMRLLRVRPTMAVSVAMMVVILYAAVALPSQAGVRSLVMCCAGAVCLLSGRIRDGLQILAIAIGTILIIVPSDLYDPGFQIGAAAVLGLIFFGRHFKAFIQSFWMSDEPGIFPHADPAPATAILRAIGNLLWGALLASAVIWISVMPLVAYYFKQTSPWAVPAGFMLLPITVVTLLSAAMKVLLTLVCPWLAADWAMAAVVPAVFLRHAVGWLAHLPAAGLPTPSPSPAMFVVYYVLISLPLIPWPWTAARWAARSAPVLACLAILLSSSVSIQASPAKAGGVRVTLLSIGAGQTALVRISGGQTFFVDCGSTTLPDVFGRAIQPYLSHEGVRRVDEIFLSHGDYDHISATAEIVQAYGVPMVRITPHFRRHAEGHPQAEALLRFLDGHGPAPTLIAAGDRVDVGGGASIRVLWPPRDCQMNSNDCGMVLQLTYAGRSILFPADIQVAPEVALLKNPRLLRSDILVAPHHGSAEISTLAFLHAVDPRWIVCSNDRMLTHKQHVFDEIAEPWPVYRTDRCGTIDLEIDGDGSLRVQTFTGAAPIEGLQTAAAR
jgi:competence protein ComEC